MPDEPPIACTLTATELPLRLAQMADLGRAALLDARVQGARAQLRFASGEGVRARVDAIVAAESQCCAFLAMDVADEPGSVVLTIEAPSGAEPVLSQFVDAFGGRPQGRTPGGLDLSP